MYTLARKQVCSVSARQRLLPAVWQALFWHLLWAVRVEPLLVGVFLPLSRHGCARGDSGQRCRRQDVQLCPCTAGPRSVPAAHGGTGTWCRVLPLCPGSCSPAGSRAPARCSRATVTASPAAQLLGHAVVGSAWGLRSASQKPGLEIAGVTNCYGRNV